LPLSDNLLKGVFPTPVAVPPLRVFECQVSLLFPPSTFFFFRSWNIPQRFHPLPRTFLIYKSFFPPFGFPSFCDFFEVCSPLPPGLFCFMLSSFIDFVSLFDLFCSPYRAAFFVVLLWLLYVSFKLFSFFFPAFFLPFLGLLLTPPIRLFDLLLAFRLSSPPFGGVTFFIPNRLSQQFSIFVTCSPWARDFLWPRFATALPPQVGCFSTTPPLTSFVSSL